MEPTHAAKTWSVRATSIGSQPLAIRCNERPFDQGAPGLLGAPTPVEYLLISVAGCFALSCRMALAQQHRSVEWFDVVVRGTKAPDAPSRLQSIEIEVVFPAGLAAEAESIVQHAKRLCTVTNTLSRSSPPQLQVRTAQADLIAHLLGRPEVK